ncbi:MAG: hypothetical protein HDT43_01395 [Ruminococcaceae bacterium]|nr:hypothetical protein [Oscillospiraceae bacterium]
MMIKQTGGNKTFRITKKVIVRSVIILIIILLFVWDAFIDAPPIWHFRQVDKQAIIQYQREHYPGAKVAKSNFPFLGNPGLVGVPVDSSMTFEYNDIEFVIAAKNGEISADGYPEARTIAQFDKIIKDGFLKPRQITSAVPLYTFYDDYKKKLSVYGRVGG